MIFSITCMNMEFGLAEEESEIMSRSKKILCHKIQCPCFSVEVEVSNTKVSMSVLN